MPVETLSPDNSMPSPVKMDINGFIRLPKIVERVLQIFPDQRALLLEKASFDPITFLHEVMVAECYADICKEYIARIPSTDMHTRDFLLDRLLSFNTAAVQHDTGKWLIEEEGPLKAVTTINSRPPLEHVLKNGNVDHRTAQEQAKHRIHPLVGTLSTALLAEQFNHTPYPILSRIQQVTGGHHEHFSKKEVFNDDGQKILSYPRPVMRINHPHDALALLFIEITDTAVAMGQPRVYRPQRKSDNQIRNSVMRIVKNYLTRYYNDAPQVDQEKWIFSFVDMSIHTLHSIQRKYPPEVCLEVQGYTDHHGEPISPEFREGHLLQWIAGEVWRSHKERLKSALDRF